MAGGRRNAARAKAAAAAASSPSDEKHSSTPTALTNKPNVSLPKHVPLPEIPVDNELDFEVMAFFSAVVAMSSQYLNLYHTVWWLPHSHMEYAMNFYLIDVSVAVFCLLMVGRRLPLALMKKIIYMIVPTSMQPRAIQVSRILSIFLVFPAIGWCILQVLKVHGLLSLFCLGYPVLVYIILFGANLLPAFELPSMVQDKPGKSRKADHVCSSSAEAVREEVQNLKADFNGRLKHVLFNSLLVAYYTAFVPCCYTQSALHYDTVWISQHIGFVWLTNFSMYTIFCFPPRFCDALHRASIHLGRWKKIETRNSHIPYSIWSQTTLWQQGALVKHSKEIYKGEGITNAAEPGNSAHGRFFGVFSNPMVAVCTLLALQSLLVLVMFGVLIRSSEWNFIISIAALILLNFPTQFKMARIYVVLEKVYQTEQLMQGRF